MHLGFLALSQFQQHNRRLPAPWSRQDAEAVLHIARELSHQAPEGSEVPLDSPLELRPVELLALTSSGTLVPLAGVLGGYVAQVIRQLPESVVMAEMRVGCRKHSRRRWTSTLRCSSSCMFLMTRWFLST